MLIQNQSLRTYQLGIGEIKPMAVVDVPEDKAQEILDFGFGELVALEVKQPAQPTEDDNETEGEEIKDEFSEMKFEALKAYCVEHEIDFKGLNSKDQLRAKIREALKA